MIDKADSLKGINYKQSLFIAQRLLVQARENDSSHLLYQALSMNSLLNWFNGEHYVALNQSFEGLAICDDLGNVAHTARRLIHIGLIHYYMADYDSALWYQQQALRKYTELSDTLQILKTHGFIGLIYNQPSNYRMAKEILLGEIRHCNKNNLQLINSLLSFQSLQLVDASVSQAVIDGQSSVQTMELIHESLYQNNQFDKVGMQSYICSLVDGLILSFGDPRHEIELSIETNDLILRASIAIKSGLITNELITNIFKHAFHGKEKQLSVDLKCVNNHSLSLVVADNDKDEIKKDGFINLNSFGLNLVSQLINKYRGDISIKTDKGASVKINLYLDSKIYE